MEQRLPLTEAQRLRDFVYHSVDINVGHAMTEIRSEYHALARRMLHDLPDCRERSLALTALEDSLMRAIQSLAVTYGEAPSEKDTP